MKGLAGVVAGANLTGMVKETKKGHLLGIYKDYDIITGLAEEMKKCDKKYPGTIINYSIHCNSTGLAFLNEKGRLEEYEYYVDAVMKGYTHYLLIPFIYFDEKRAYRCSAWFDVMLRPNLEVDIRLLGRDTNERVVANRKCRRFIVTEYLLHD